MWKFSRFLVSYLKNQVIFILTWLVIWIDTMEDNGQWKLVAWSGDNFWNSDMCWDGQRRAKLFILASCLFGSILHSMQLIIHHLAIAQNYSCTWLEWGAGHGRTLRQNTENSDTILIIGSNQVVTTASNHNFPNWYRKGCRSLQQNLHTGKNRLQLVSSGMWG